MRYEITFDGRLRRTDGGALIPDELEGFLDRFVSELEVLDAEDIDVSTNLVAGTIRVVVSTESEELLGAQLEGNTQIRTAFHAAGVATPGWSIDWTKATTVPDGELIDA